MDTVLASVSAVSFDLPVKIRDREGFGEFDAAIAFDPLDDVSRSGLKVWAGAVVVELELLSMCGYCRHDRLCGLLPVFEG